MRGLKQGIRRETDYGCIERYCRKCQEWWPEDAEFFYWSHGRFNTPCRACIQEQKQQASAVLPCSAAGCNEPRYRSRHGRYTSYCAEHQYHKRKQVALAQAAHL